MSTAKELVVKARRKNASINSKVWIGDAVTKASNLSSLGNKDGVLPIVFSELSYTNFIEQLVENNPDQDPKSWFKEDIVYEYGVYYSADIIVKNFCNWIENGMNHKPPLQVVVCSMPKRHYYKLEAKALQFGLPFAYSPIQLLK